MQQERLLNEVLQLRDSGAVYQVLRVQDKAFFYSKSWGERRGLTAERFTEALATESTFTWGLGYLQMPVFGYDLEVRAQRVHLCTVMFFLFYHMWLSCAVALLTQSTRGRRW